MSNFFILFAVNELHRTYAVKKYVIYHKVTWIKTTASISLHNLYVLDLIFFVIKMVEF